MALCQQTLQEPDHSPALSSPTHQGSAVVNLAALCHSRKQSLWLLAVNSFHPLLFITVEAFFNQNN